MYTERIVTRSTAPCGRVIVTTTEIEADFLAQAMSRGMLHQCMALHGHRINGDPLNLLCEFIASPAKTLADSE